MPKGDATDLTEVEFSIFLINFVVYRLVSKYSKTLHSG